MRPPFLAVDWGTTNRRAYLVGDDGTVRAEHEDELGILGVPAGGFEAATADLAARFDGGDRLPMLLGGMIGSNRGWVEAPYVSCPAGIPELARGIRWIEPGRIGIVPGMSFLDPPTADVMRGEEVQILGAIADGQLPDHCLVCHPGTHNKWIEVAGGCINSFRTVMTGELFNLLRKHSILSDLLAAEAGTGKPFRDGVDHGMSHPDLTAELFQVRARTLLGQAAREDAASYVSGLLIGADLRIGLGHQRHDRVHVVGRPELTRLFAAAIEQTGRAAVEFDGERAFVAGMRHIAEKL
jgi:2-dehydro-3-deoxygalactonokinase